MVISQIHEYAIFGWETTFGTTASTINIPFGHKVRLTDTRRNNLEAVYDLGNIEAGSLQVKQFEGTCTVDFQAGTGSWIRALTGTTSTVTGSGPYNHNYIETRTGSVQKPISKTKQSFTIERGYDIATDTTEYLLGCVLNGATLRSAVDGMVEVSLDIAYSNMESMVDALETSTTILYDNQTDTPFYFAHSSLELPDGTAIGKVQNMELRFTRNTKMVRENGTRTAVDAVHGGVEYELTADVAFETTTMLAYFLGSGRSPQDNVAEQASVQLIFDNGAATTSKRGMQFTFTNAKIEEYGRSSPDNDLTVESITMKLRKLTSATVINNFATAL